MEQISCDSPVSHIPGLETIYAGGIPEQITNASRDEDDAFSGWLAARVRPNAEKTVHAMLQFKDIEVFLPTFRERRQWSDRLKEIEAPLFPGYVFCRINIGRRASVLKTPGVIGFAGAGYNPLFICEREIESIRTMVRAGLLPQPCPYLQEGQRVRIKTGSLAGIEGIVQKVKTQFRLVVSIELLKRAVAAEFDASFLQPIV